MVSLLLIISFILHIIFFIALYYLYQQLKKKKMIEEKAIEQLLARFLQEIKLENEQLQKQLKEETTSTIKTVEKKHSSANTKIYKPSDLSIRISEKPKDKIETSMTGEILNLYHQGVHIEEIARKIK